MPRKTMVRSEKCENASVLTFAPAAVPESAQYSRNASIHCSEGSSLSFTRTCPSSSTSSPSALIEVLMLPGILTHECAMGAARQKSAPSHSCPAPAAVATSSGTRHSEGNDLRSSRRRRCRAGPALQSQHIQLRAYLTNPPPLTPPCPSGLFVASRLAHYSA